MESRIMRNKASKNGIVQVLCQLFIVALTISALAACSRRYDELPAYWPVPFREYDNQSVGRFKSSYLAEQIDNYYRGTSPGPIGVTTLVNLDDLYETSSFGRVYSEQLISELAMRGYDVVELRHADALRFLSDGGEFALSRERGAVRAAQELGAVVVGTYQVSPERVYVNARLINPSTSMVLSAGSVEMEKTKEIAKMLRSGGIPVALERIPVKHLTYGETPLFAANKGQLYDQEETVGQFSRPAPVAPKFVEPEAKKSPKK